MRHGFHHRFWNHALAFVVMGWMCVVTAPTARSEPFWGQDKTIHLVVSTTIALGGYAISSEPLKKPWQRTLAAIGFSMSAGLAKEAADAAGLGHASAKDLVWDFIGATTGALLGLVIDTVVPQLDLADHPQDQKTDPVTFHHVLPHHLVLPQHF